MDRRRNEREHAFTQLHALRFALRPFAHIDSACEQPPVASGQGDARRHLVAAETPRSLNLTLQQGAETQSITVNADLVPVLQTGDASIGSTIDSAEITRLPTFGSDPYELLRTAPGLAGRSVPSRRGKTRGVRERI